jgi:crotonobetainyl-CoA:carnitine CoA-transferase CaiB-like acyl-CoA transferase
MTAILTQIFKTKTPLQWLDLPEQQGVPARLVHKLGEVFRRSSSTAFRNKGIV